MKLLEDDYEDGHIYSTYPQHDNPRHSHYQAPHGGQPSPCNQSQLEQVSYFAGVIALKLLCNAMWYSVSALLRIFSYYRI